MTERQYAAVLHNSVQSVVDICVCTADRPHRIAAVACGGGHSRATQDEIVRIRGDGPRRHSSPDTKRCMVKIGRSVLLEGILTGYDHNW
jgi:hypothetical protein